jgi:hypothetical protein
MMPAVLSSTNGSTGSHPARGYVVRSRTALLSAMLIGSRRTGITASASDGEWVDVPDDALITEPNRAGRTMVWPYKADRWTDHPHTEIRCFIPGSMG